MAKPCPRCGAGISVMHRLRLSAGYCFACLTEINCDQTAWECEWLGHRIQVEDFWFGGGRSQPARLFIVNSGKIAVREAAVKLSRLDSAPGKPVVSTADLSQLTVTEAVAGRNAVLTIVGALNVRPWFSMDDASATHAKVIAVAIQAAKL